MTGSPVVAVNHAMVIAESRRPEEGLAALGKVDPDQRLSQYQPYWAARAELLARCGHTPRPIRPMRVRSRWSLIRAFAGSCKIEEPATWLHPPLLVRAGTTRGRSEREPAALLAIAGAPAYRPLRVNPRNLVPARNVCCSLREPTLCLLPLGAKSCP
jgi:hypothetical protein